MVRTTWTILSKIKNLNKNVEIKKIIYLTAIAWDENNKTTLSKWLKMLALRLPMDRTEEETDNTVFNSHDSKDKTITSLKFTGNYTINSQSL